VWSVSFDGIASRFESESAHVALFQMKVEDAEEIDGTAQRKHAKSEGSDGHAEYVLFLGPAMLQGGPVFFYPLLLGLGGTERRLNGLLEPAPVVVLKRYEPERLLTQRNRS